MRLQMQEEGKEEVQVKNFREDNMIDKIQTKTINYTKKCSAINMT